MPATIGAHARFRVKLHLVAMLFVLFNVTIVFVLGRTVADRELSES